MAETTEVEVTQRVVSDLESEGYDVMVQPGKLAVPSFLGDYRPDLIARRNDKNLIIEIKRRVSGASERLQKIAELVRGRPDWEFRIIWIEPNSSSVPLSVQERALLKRRLAESRSLADIGHTEPALLTAWATLEAVARSLLQDHFRRAQSPGRLIEILASGGYLTPTEADRLRALANVRNRFIHGELEMKITRGELMEMASVIDVLIEQIADR